MASPETQQQPIANPPETLPADFFEQQGAAPPPTPGMLDTISAKFRENTQPQDTGHPFVDAMHNFGAKAATTFVQPFIHPSLHGTDFMKAIGVGQPTPEETAEQQKWASHPIANRFGEDVGNFLLSGALTGMEAPTQRLAGAFHPYESPALPPGTGAYQRFAARIGPEAKAEALKVLPGLEEGVPAEHASISRFAQESNIPLKTPEEYGTAAGRLREQVTTPFYEQLQKPFENDRIAVSPKVAAYTAPGELQPLGTHPTVAELNSALNKANQLAGPGYEGGANAYDRAQVIAAKDIAHEIGGQLNEYLSSKSNLSPEEVGTWRQRGGVLGNIEENALARARSNRLAQGKSPLEAGTVKGFLLRSGQALLGGPEPIANRQFRSSLSKLPEGTPQEIPQIQLQAPGGAIPPANFSPRATAAGPEPVAPPPVRYGPQPESVNAPALRFTRAPDLNVSPPPVRFGPSEPEPPSFRPPPVKFAPKEQPPQFRGPAKPLTEAPPIKFSESGRTEPAPRQVKPKRGQR